MSRLTFILACCFFFTFAKGNVPLDNPPMKASEVFIPVGNSGKLISIQDLSVISAKDLQTLTGKRMSLIQKISFKINQHKLRKSIHSDGTLDKDSEAKYFALFGMFNIGGLLLGIFLSLIGVLIAYLIKTGDHKGRIKWAWIGAIISFIVVGAIVI